MQTAAPLTIEPVPSRQLLAAQFIAHLAAAISILGSQVPGWAAALLLIVVGGSFARLRKAKLPSRLTFYGDGRIERVGAGGTATEAWVHPQTVVTAAGILLLVRERERISAIPLPGDSISSEDFRRLRVMLRWLIPASDAA